MWMNASLCLATAAVVLGACGGEPVSNHQNPAAPAVEEMDTIAGTAYPDTFDGAERLEHGANGTVARVLGEQLFAPLEADAEIQRLTAHGDYEQLAYEFLNYYRKPLRILNPYEELSVSRVQEDSLGFHQVRFSQTYESMPIIDAGLIVHINADDRVYMLTGDYVETPTAISLAPKMTIDEVLAGLTDQGELTPIDQESSLAILPQDNGEPVLVYRVRAAKSLVDQSILLVNANDGSVVRKDATVYSAN
jgi:hypothetical protein